MFDYDMTVFDAQGGGMGKAVIRAVKLKAPQTRILAVGTNAMATAAMLKAGADMGATGENAVIYNCTRAHVAVAPIGFLLANAMYGEITPAMARAIGETQARLILIPVRQCSAQVVGTGDMPMAERLECAAQAALDALAEKDE